MKFKIYKRWKWLAKDSGGIWWFYTSNRPQRMSFEWWPNSGKSFRLDALFSMPKMPWKHSLHKRAGDAWVKVNDYANTPAADVDDVAGIEQ